jgi:hypothetical protein
MSKGLAIAISFVDGARMTARITTTATRFTTTLRDIEAIELPQMRSATKRVSRGSSRCILFPRDFRASEGGSFHPCEQQLVSNRQNDGPDK